MKFIGGVPQTPPTVPGQPNEADWATGLVSAVDFQIGRDGALWWLSQFDVDFTPGSGRLGRIAWKGGPAGVDDPVPSRLALSAHPNPFAGRTELSFRFERAGRVRLAVYDLAGRRLARLADGVRGAGVHRIVWDGALDGGGQAAPGLYVARLEAHGWRESIRLVRTE